MQTMELFAVLAQNVPNRVSLDPLANVLNDHCASFRPHSRVKDLSDEGLSNLIVDRLKTCDKVVSHSPYDFPMTLMNSQIRRICWGRVFTDYLETIRDMFEQCADGYDYEDIRRYIDPKGSTIREQGQWTTFLASVAKDALFSKRKKILVHLPAWLKTISGMIVVADALLLLPIYDVEGLFNVALYNYVDNISNPTLLSWEGFYAYYSFILVRHIRVMITVRGLYGYSVLPFNARTINGHMDILSPDELMTSLKAAVDPSSYQHLRLDIRLNTEHSVARMLTAKGGGE
jgi:hypothetical protein